MFAPRTQLKNSIMKKLSTEWIIIIGFIITKLTIHFLTNTNYGLHRDALLYYSLGENLAWGYVSVPPLIAIFSSISTFLFGNTVFAIRFFPAITGGLSVIFIAKIVKELKGSNLAIIIALIAFIVSPAFLRSNTLFQPVSFNQFFWLLSGYFVTKLIHTQNPKFWYYLFICWGVAFLNKYSITFFILATLISLSLTPHRKLIVSKQFIIAGFISVLIILPNLFWQYNHNWPVVHHMSELQRTQLVNVSIAGFIIDQLIMNLPGLIVWLTGVIVFLFFKQEKQYRALAFIYLFTVLTILLLRGKPYYTLGLYPILFALGGYAVDKYFKKILKYGLIPFMLILAFPMLPLSLPIYNLAAMEEFTKPMAEFTNRWEDGVVHNLPQDYADMTGWDELADIVTMFYNSLTEKEKTECIIYAENYGQAGAINFYGKKNNIPSPISFNDNFLLWAPDTIKNSPLIYINHEVGDIEFLFDSYTKIGQVDNKYFRENGVQVYYCTHPKDTFKIFYADKVKELKLIYKRD